MKSIFQLKNVNRFYGDGNTLVKALVDVNLTIYEGEFSTLMGPSGSGKSTLLNIMSGLDNASAGDVYLNDENMASMSSTKLCDYRRDNIGFVFQSYNLIPVLTVKENVEYIMMLQGVDSDERAERVSEILKMVGLEGRERFYPPQLSGGQQQRVAVARAMVTKPSIILADEPTANLDSKTGEALLDMMKDLNEQFNMTFVFATHDPMIMDKANRLIKLHDGKIISSN